MMDALAVAFNSKLTFEKNGSVTANITARLIDQVIAIVDDLLVTLAVAVRLPLIVVAVV